MLTLTTAQIREIDRLAIEEIGIPGMVLMENAARSVAQVVLDLLNDEMHLVPQDARVVVLCGGGNNGGDGYAIARHLHNASVDVAVFAAKDPGQLEGDAAINASIVHRMGIEIVPATDDMQVAAARQQWQQEHLIIDALLGTGFTGELRSPLDSLIAGCNDAHEAGVRVIAVDVPSGLNADTGQPVSGIAVEADITVTFVAAKPGLVGEAAQPHVGELVIADIGAPPALIRKVM